MINRAISQYRGDQVYAVALRAALLSFPIYSAVHVVGERLDWQGTSPPARLSPAAAPDPPLSGPGRATTGSGTRRVRAARRRSYRYFVGWFIVRHMCADGL